MRALLLLLSIAMGSACSWNLSYAATDTTPSVTSAELQAAMKHEKDQVSVFKFISQQADLLGVHVGWDYDSAAAFSHYVKWDLERTERRSPLSL